VIWTNKPPPRRRTAAADLRTKDRTISVEAQQAEKPIDFWHILFTEEMLDLIVLHTNDKIQAVLRYQTNFLQIRIQIVIGKR
jgi:hypothetical protein